MASFKHFNLGFKGSFKESVVEDEGRCGVRVEVGVRTCTLQNGIQLKCESGDSSECLDGFAFVFRSLGASQGDAPSFLCGGVAFVHWFSNSFRNKLF